MNLDKVDALKQKGNEAFKLKELYKAIDYYSEAIDLVADSDPSKLAILHSNRAQTYLVQKRYPEALADAEQSLSYGPNFTKSILRRATANAELGNKPEAVMDLRRVLQLEPTNLTVLSLMAKVSSPAKMSKSLAESFTGHYLRRITLKANPTDDDSVFVSTHELFRVMFISVKNLPYLRHFLNGSSIGDFFDCIKVILPRWFICKQMLLDTRVSTVATALSNKALKLVFELLHPRLCLFVSKNEGANRLKDLYDYYCVAHTLELDLDDVCKDQRQLQEIQDCLPILTRIPYFSQLQKLKDKSFPKVDTIFTMGNKKIDMNFLKAWKEYNWGAKTMVFRGYMPDVSNFERFDGPISDKVTSLHIPFDSELRINDVKIAYKQIRPILAIMKRVFPSLNEVVAVYENRFPFMFHSVYVAQKLKSCITYLATKFNDKLKPQWCTKQKVLVNIFEVADPDELILFNMRPLEQIVEECRREIAELKSIRLCGPSPITFYWCDHICAAVMIRMETEHAEFEIAFRPNFSYDYLNL